MTQRKNLLHEGRPQATGTILKSVAMETILDHVADRLHWKDKFDRGNGTIKRGRGVAVALKACVSPTTSVCPPRRFRRSCDSSGSGYSWHPLAPRKSR